ncbi:MAG: DUF4349 domain-containing protein [Cyclobacteriaceae bacterium]|nr:DUF4349 domain-containing protein [Cyclobacteriaceae bacterium]
MKRLRYHIIYISLFFIACSNEKYESGDLMEAEYEEVMDVPATMQTPLSDETISKKIIKSSGIDFQTENIEETYKIINNFLPKYNAYIENENQTKSDYSINYDLTIRVPSNVHDSLYNSISNSVFRLDSKYSNIEDVTERYYDLKTRIKNKKSLEQRYLTLLSKASNVKDIIEIEKNINEIRTIIEQLEGQFNYLSKQINFSTIQLSFYEILPYTYTTQRFGTRVLNALNNGWEGFLSFIVGVTTLWPFIIIMIGGIYLFRKIKNRWKRNK